MILNNTSSSFRCSPEASGLRRALAVLRRVASTSSATKKASSGCQSTVNNQFKLPLKQQAVLS
jgi:hypothetical protein